MLLTEYLMFLVSTFWAHIVRKKDLEREIMDIHVVTIILCFATIDYVHSCTLYQNLDVTWNFILIHHLRCIPYIELTCSNIVLCLHVSFPFNLIYFQPSIFLFHWHRIDLLKHRVVYACAISTRSTKFSAIDISFSWSERSITFSLNL